MVIGIFVHSDGFFQNPILQGAREAAQEHRANLLIYQSPTMSNYSGLDAATIQPQYKVEMSDIDGLILSYAAAGLTQYGLSLFRAGLPVMSIGRSLEELPHLLLENSMAIRDIVVDLASRGHREIAFLAGPGDNQCAVDRLVGYREGIRMTGLSENPRMILQGAFEESPGHVAVRAAWRDGMRFSALVCANDQSAIGGIKALREFGISVPRDVEITGFDDSIVSKLSRPTLSTYATNNFELGYRAADQIVRAVRGEAIPTRTMIPVDFVARTSTRTASHEGLRSSRRSDFWSMPPREANLWLDRLGRIKDSEAPLKQMETCASSEEFVASATALLKIAEEHTIPPACLHDAIVSAANHSPEISPLAVSEALGRLHETILRLEYGKADLETQFDLHTVQLRQFTTQPTEEEILLGELKRVLWELGVPSAEIYLTAESSVSDAGVYNAVYWFRSATQPHYMEERRRLTAFSIRHMTAGQGATTGCWMIVPLIFHDLQYGVALVSRETSHEFLLPGLIQQFSTAIYTNRVHRALANANRDLEVSRNAAEEANSELKKAQTKLIETSRLAGMSEVATGILHNVGNVLNSVNVSAALVGDQLRHSKVANVARTCELLRTHEADLAAFLCGDPKGKLVIPYLTNLAEALAAERATMTTELEGLQKNIDHIKEIVSMQQSYAKTSGVAETVSVTDLVEDALSMNSVSLARHDVNVVRDFQARPVVTLEKHKVLQVLVNLVRNAKYACDESGRPDKQVTIRTTANYHSVSIAVIDNGVGIPQENLTRIFAHGFTTRKDGHGFGLHSGALAAKEIGGTLTGHSVGPDKGATFILELPYKSDAVKHEKLTA
jgi:DNA-binding LacI/PurR family transcriptional regulator/C4-dicarboxylate-specific signal transduction histidine kinase